jgi:hypothetical protein
MHLACKLNYLSNGSSGEVGDVVPVVLDLSEQLSHSGLRPVAANDRQDVAENVGLGDGAVDVGDDDLVGPLPEVEVAAAAGGALVSRRDAELNLVHAWLQVEAALEGDERGLT